MSAAASSTSPSAKTTLDSPNEPAASIIPVPKKTGNQLQDEQETVVHHCLCELVSNLNTDRSLVPPMYIKLMTLARDRQKGIGDTEAKFTKISTPQKLDAVWIILFLSSWSDLTAGDIIQCKGCDEDSITQLFTY